jgi:hypothetical protein
MMKVIPKELSALMTSMSIIDTKETALWPVLILSILRLNNIEND